MQHSTAKLLPLVAFAIIGTAAASAQSAIDQLRPLVETSARRLIIAEQVALAKWDSGGAVEDLPREAQIIMGAVRDGESRGLEPTSVSNFFKAQIEANKLVQYSLLADWHRSGRAPSHPSIDLGTTIRPALDKLESSLIAELTATASIRQTKTCRADVAAAVGKYVLAHEHDLGRVQAIALDRALAATCTP